MITLILIGAAIVGVWAWVGYRLLRDRALARYDASRKPAVWGLPKQRLY